MNDKEAYEKVKGLLESGKYPEFGNKGLFIKNMYDAKGFYVMDIKCRYFSDEINKYFAFIYTVEKATGNCEEIFIKNQTILDIVMMEDPTYKNINIEQLA